MKKKLACLILICVVVICGAVTMAACSVANKADYAPMEVGESIDKDEVQISEINRKIYYQVYLNIESEEPQKIVDVLKAQTVEKGGYVENTMESTSAKYLSYRYTVRIPTEKLNDFLSALEGTGKVASKNIRTVDVTTSYVNAQARIDALKSEREALDGLMKKDGISVADVLTIGKRISEINAELNSLDIQINQYDSLIDYSTVTVYAYTPSKTPVAAIVVPIVIVVVIIGIIVTFIVVRKKKKAKKQAEGERAKMSGENSERSDKI